MSQTKDHTAIAVPLIFLAFERGHLSSQQAMESCLAYGRWISEQCPAALDEFWQAQGWVTSDVFAQLYQELAQSIQPTVAKYAPEQSAVLLQTLQQSLRQETLQQAAHQHQQGDSSQEDLAYASTVALDSETLPHAKNFPPAPGVMLPSPLLDTLQQQEASATGEVLASILPAWTPVSEPELRYEEGELLGRGGLGQVTEVFDRNIGRHVARKTLLKGVHASAEEFRSFLEEVCLTGQLEHPNIIPVYDMGILADGQFFYTMRRISSHTLQQAMAENRLSLVQYVKILQQVCMGLEYAHSLGVVHRDIKPDNIILGNFGEVLILDWGVAKAGDAQELNVEHIPQAQSTPTQMYKGTPLYMAPEAIRSGFVSPGIDQYALGVVLYQILTGHYPFMQENIFALLYQVATAPLVAPRKRAPDRDIPAELEQTCIRMLAKTPEERFPSMRHVHDQLEEFLEGTKERERRHYEARERIVEAQKLAQEFLAKTKSLSVLREDWEEAQRQFQPWEPLETRRSVWDKEVVYKQAQQDEVRLFGAAVQKFTQALDHEPGNVEARRGLATLYWKRFVDAERQQDTLQQILYRDLVLLYDDGYYQALLSGDVTLRISTRPAGATVRLYAFEEQERRLVPVLQEEAGTTPMTLSYPAGSYLLKLEHEGYQEVQLPILLQRGEPQEVEVTLYQSAEIGAAYLYIPQGPFPFGGDTQAPMSLPLRTVYVDDFFISKHPITFQEYLAFLNDIRRDDPEVARQMVPRSAQEEYAVLRNQQYVPDYNTLFHGPITERYPLGEGHIWRLPILGVSWFEAVLYCRWRSAQEGRLVTLPTEEQWEKAATGVDSRIFPWGNDFDASFCKMARSRPPAEMQAEPVGAFAGDVSPYGMCDVVGTISEWMLTLSQEEVDALQEDPQITAIQRGGGWLASNERVLRARTRVPRPEGKRSYNCGFRVVAYPAQQSYRTKAYNMLS